MEVNPHKQKTRLNMHADWAIGGCVDVKRGFTLVELLVVLAVVGLLLALVLPSLSRAKAKGKQAACLNNLKQIAAASIMYATDDANGKLSPKTGLNEGSSVRWLWDYLKGDPRIFMCPATQNGPGPQEVSSRTGAVFYDGHLRLAGSTQDPRGTSYDILPFYRDYENFWNGNREPWNNANFVTKSLSELGSFKHEYDAFGFYGMSPGPAATWIACDTDKIRDSEPWFPGPANNHGVAGMNAAFCDGHVEWLTPSQVVRSHEFSQDNNRTREKPP